MKDALSELSPEQVQFICSECSVDEETLFDMDEDVYDRVYDFMCDIECRETPSGDEKISDRCAMASDIVTILGNTIPDED